ncbi:MAG: hypothetical protein DMG97_14495 [Acidobacteria bacterium]|nr:MAG: hypothetical protein DMG96_30615 [Acidobacteriota bacterium]PYV72010.1 MAG: hypothetical protein DMG97_14495 [Acidobacteriota bacterium]
MPLEFNSDVKPHLTELIIKSDSRVQMLESLDRHGINSRTLFPDLEGLCRYPGNMNTHNRSLLWAPGDAALNANVSQMNLSDKKNTGRRYA